MRGETDRAERTLESCIGMEAKYKEKRRIRCFYGREYDNNIDYTFNFS